MKSRFITPLDARARTDEIWVVTSALKFWSEKLNAMVIVPPWLDPDYTADWDEGSCFETDFASVPRLPIIFVLWGDRAHAPATLHDFVYCIDGVIYIYSDEARGEEGYRHPGARVIMIDTVTRKEADDLFLEAMIATGTPKDISGPMYQGVRLGGSSHYHKRKATDRL